jgi:FMN phosphatase YigB (HAD superfamily)
MSRVLLWDFDGTLAARRGMWAACMLAEVYAIALRSAGAGAEAWMVGDNYEADVAGAQAVGLRAVLARTSDAHARYAVATLDELDRIIA